MDYYDIIHSDGNLISFPHYRDWNDNPIERTPEKYPYSYSPYVIQKRSDTYKDCVYSDRLLQWGYDKHNELCEKHFGNKGQLWDGREFDKIQEFLREYLDKPNLELVGIMKGCNVSSGYPYWIFMFNH